jgi:hypothetical protein
MTDRVGNHDNRGKRPSAGKLDLDYCAPSNWGGSRGVQSVQGYRGYLGYQ